MKTADYFFFGPLSEDVQVSYDFPYGWVEVVALELVWGAFFTTSIET